MNGMPYEEWYKKNVLPIINQSWLDAGYTQEQIDSGEALRLDWESCEEEPHVERDPRERESRAAELVPVG